MAQADRCIIGEESQEASGKLGLGTPSEEDLLRSFIAYSDFFNDLETHPEGDVRHRFFRLRALLARYVERLVRGHERAWNDFQAEVKSGKLDPGEQECQSRFHAIMVGSDKSLAWYSRLNSDDSKTAHAPVVDQYMMDNVYRYHMDGKGLRAPNGELRTMYGCTGDSPAASLAALRGCDDDFVRCLIRDWMVVPFNRHVFVQLHKCYNTLLGRDVDVPPQGLSGGTLDILVSAMECLVGVGVFAASVMLLYNLNSTKDRLIAAPFASLACAIPVIFFSTEAKGIFTLIAGNWAVLVVIVFLSTTNFNLRTD